MNLNQRRFSLASVLTLIVITSALSFAAAGFVFFGADYFNGRYAVLFDPGKVEAGKVTKFNQVKNILERDFYENVDENTLLEGAIAGMAKSLNDPYTRYLPVEQKKAETEGMQGSYEGIGASVNMDENNTATFVEIYEGSGAQEAGILPGDRLVKVNGTDVTQIKELNKIVDMIKGEENSKVLLTIYRDADKKLIDKEVIRKKITGVYIKSEVLPGQIGWIRMEKFDYEIYNSFKTHLDQLLKKGIKGLIIDVRDNPGGAYTQAVQIADRLLPKGLIVYTEDKYKKKESKYSDDTELGLPLVLVINGNSASASEVLAGAIKDNNKGVLVGTRSFGKGLVQGVMELDDGSGINVTIARYFTPSGVCIHGIGIQPDVEIQVDEKYKGFPVSRIPRNEDVQLKKAIEVIKDLIAGKTANG